MSNDTKTILTSDVTKTIVKEANSMLLAPDWKRWAKNAFIFSVPALIVFLLVLQGGGTLKEAMVAIYGAIINALLDILRKYQAEVIYKPQV